MKKRTFLGIFIIAVLITLTFVLSFISDQKNSRQIAEKKREVLTYLKDKYHEDFTIDSYSYVHNTYDVYRDDDLVTLKMDKSYVYTFKVSSARLIKFDVIYVTYEDDDEYEKYAQYNIRKKGIYENYIYEYKIRDIRTSIKDGVLSKIDQASDLEVSIDEISLDESNILVDHSLDGEDTKELYAKYREIDKNISDIDYYELCSAINRGSSLKIDMNVNRYIDKSNVSQLQVEVRELVSFLREQGYDDYDINLHFKNYQTARIIRYFDDDGEEEIYMVFDYEEYADVEQADKLSVYIF